MSGIYVHIPFCVKKCAYCDFTSYVSRSYDDYVGALINEINASHWDDAVDTIFFGGGTPSLIGAQRLCAVLAVLRARFFVAPNAEITVECNPGTVQGDFFSRMADAGVNRISIGAQTSDDDLLKLIGRIHSWHEVEDAVSAAKAAGITNINLDLMYALPTQTQSMWRETLNRAVGLGVTHMSCYALTLAAGTPICAYRDQIPDEETELRMMADTRQMLGVVGFERYEISNYAVPGYECEHNINYWTNDDYLGLGCAAHSHLCSRRWANTPDLDGYIAGKNIMAESKDLSKHDQMFEEMMLGLRMTRGIKRTDFYAKYGVQPEDVFAFGMAKLKKLGMLLTDEHHIRLTDTGLNVQNAALVELL